MRGGMDVMREQEGDEEEQGGEDESGQDEGSGDGWLDRNPPDDLSPCCSVYRLPSNPSWRATGPRHGRRP